MIVCLGDSITFGQHVSEAEAWPALLHGYEIVPAGVSSDTTRLGLERFPRDVQQRNPKGVVLQFGHNDANRWETDRGLPRVSESAYKANLEEMVDRCRIFSAVPYLCTITPSVRSSQHALDVRVYDEILRDVARERGVMLIDVRSIFEAWGVPAAEGDKELLLEDGLHLSPTGHRVYAGAVQRVLDASGL